MSGTWYLFVEEGAGGYGLAHGYTGLFSAVVDGVTEVIASGTLLEVLKVAAGL